jgi:hypothetical protein
MTQLEKPQGLLDGRGTGWARGGNGSGRGARSCDNDKGS